jgi:Flp pilus assembly protein TadD
MFRGKTAQVVLDSAWMDLKAGRFDAARQGAERRLALKPNDARGHYLLGEIVRQKGDRGGAAQAIAHYRRAIAADRSYPEPHKGLGLAHLELGEKSHARRSLETYLSIAPQANDRAYIEEYIAQCK